MLFCAAPAWAGEGLVCDDGHDVTVDLPVAGGVGLSLLGVTIKVGDQVWTMDPAVKGATLVTSVQSFAFPDLYAFDFADPNQEKIVARVRLLNAHEDGFVPVFAGTLQIAGVGDWAITCPVG